MAYRPVPDYYRHHVSPPFAKTYYPTAEEFSDPFTYVDSIQNDGRHYGVIKIVPPKGFRPPFALARNLEFRPRAQRLCMTDIFVKEHHLLFDKMRSFYEGDVQKRRVPMFDEKPLNFSLYLKAIEKHNIRSDLDNLTLWKNVANECSIPEKHAVSLRYYYVTVVMDFHLMLLKEQKLRKMAANGDTPVGCSYRQKEDSTTDDLSDEIPDGEIENAPSPPDFAEDSDSISMENESRQSAFFDDESLQSALPDTVSLPTDEAKSSGSLKSNDPTNEDTNLSAKRPRFSDEADDEIQFISSNCGSIVFTRSNLVMKDVSFPQGEKSTLPNKQPMWTSSIRNSEEKSRNINEEMFLDLPELEKEVNFLPKPKFPKTQGQFTKNHHSADQLPREFVISAQVAKNFFDAPEYFSLQGFKDHADKFKAQYFKKKKTTDVRITDIEREFWRNLENLNSELYAFYGADLNSGNFGSGFPIMPKNKEEREKMNEQFRFYAQHPWNLNNMPVANKSAFSHLEANISGMTIPWVYVGMCFSLFCWHVEDHWTYSINYMHEGETKVWYGIPEKDAAKFDDFMRSLASESFAESKDLLHHMNTLIHPQILRDHGINVYTVHQNIGDIVITFPRAYHAGFNAGYNIAEAVNFAPYDWLKSGRMCLQNYADAGRSCVFSHDSLVLNMTKQLRKLNKKMYKAVFDELCAIVIRDCGYRLHLMESNFDFRKPTVSLSEFVVNEDFRSCVKCNTLLYSCAVICKHMRAACPIHYEGLCDICPPTNLRFAYSEDPISLTFKLSNYLDLTMDKRTKPSLFQTIINAVRKQILTVDDDVLKLLFALSFNDDWIAKSGHKKLNHSLIGLCEESMNTCEEKSHTLESLLQNRKPKSRSNRRNRNVTIFKHPSKPQLLPSKPLTEVFKQRISKPRCRKIYNKWSCPKHPEKVFNQHRIKGRLSIRYCSHSDAGKVCRRCCITRQWCQEYRKPRPTNDSKIAEEDESCVPQPDHVNPLKAVLYMTRRRTKDHIKQLEFVRKMIEYQPDAFRRLVDGTVIDDDLDRLDFLCRVQVLKAAEEMPSYKLVNSQRNAARKAGCQLPTGNYTNFTINDLQKLLEQGRVHLPHPDVKRGLIYVQEMLEKAHTCVAAIKALYSERGMRGCGLAPLMEFANNYVYPFTWLGEPIYLLHFEANDQLMRIAKDLQLFFTKTLHPLDSIKNILNRYRKNVAFANSPEQRILKEAQTHADRLQSTLLLYFKPQNPYYRIFDANLFNNGHCALGRVTCDTQNFKLEGFLQCREKTVQHVQDGHACLKKYIPQLLELNKMKNPNESKIRCSCNVVAVENPDQPFNWITCLVCGTVNHIGCAIWNEHFDKVRRGAYFCPRCIRGKKPHLSRLRSLLNDDMGDLAEFHLLSQFIHAQEEIYQRFYSLNLDSLPLHEFQKEVSIILASDVTDDSSEEKILNHPHLAAYFTRDQITRMMILKKLNKAYSNTCSGRVSIFDHRNPRKKAFSNTTILKENRFFECYGVPCKVLSGCTNPQGRSMAFRCSTKKCTYYCHFDCIKFDLNVAEEIEHFTCPDCSNHKN
ncbi:hypothetical protein FO519_001666 [Halicephalobus sp. NKZ332]|nr:hypothetical protein FO519_001666 [Halicephalobus sp. NKZ332]